MEPAFIYVRYHILIDGSYNNQKKRVPLTQAQIAHFNFHTTRAFDDIPTHQTGQIIVEAIADEGWAVVMPYWRNDCNNETTGRRKMIAGNGPNVLIGFQPEAPCLVDPQTGDYKPGGSPSEALFHELVHAFLLVTETASDRKGPSVVSGSSAGYPEYDTEDDFFAILIANIFSSEIGRPLRGGHSESEALPANLSTNAGFLAVEAYARLVKQFCSDHSSVCDQLRNVRSAFNPIGFLLSREVYQRSLEYRAGALCGRPEEPDSPLTGY